MPVGIVSFAKVALLLKTCLVDAYSLKKDDIIFVLIARYVDTINIMKCINLKFLIKNA